MTLPPKVVDISGERFGSLIVHGFVDLRTRNGKGSRLAIWRCECDCGVVKEVTGIDLRSGNSRSCGCKKSAALSAARTTHGHGSHRDSSRKSPTYVAWCSMKSRCNSRANNRYQNYGGRGIKVCDRWEKFENFLADMGVKPSGLSLDRINVNGNYEPSNCRWATMREQMQNQSTNKYLSVNGVVMVQAEAARLLGLHQRELSAWTRVQKRLDDIGAKLQTVTT